MANIKSAKKRARQTEVKRVKNLNRKTAIKTAVKRVLEALDNNEPKEVTFELFKNAEAKIARAKCKRVLHKNCAARKIGRLAKKVAQKYEN